MLLAMRRASSHGERSGYVRINLCLADIDISKRLPIRVQHFVGRREFAQLSMAAGSVSSFSFCSS